MGIVSVLKERISMKKEFAVHVKFRAVGFVLKETQILAQNALIILGQKYKKESVYVGLLLGKSQITLAFVVIVWPKVVALVLGTFLNAIDA